VTTAPAIAAARREGSHQATVESWVRFTFALPEPDPSVQARRLRGAVELAQFADRAGISGVRVDEHHATDFGWSPNPILESGIFLAATERIKVKANAALGPLYDPVRLAEDIAVLDQLAGERFAVVFGLGYRPIEYAAMRRLFTERGKLMDELLDTLLKAWSGEPFEYHGSTIRVTPVPVTRPHPNIVVGGSALATARRAVRFGLPLDLPAYLPEIKAYYEQLCAEAGIKPRVTMAPPGARGPVFLAEDPERAWAEFGPYFLWEAVNYSRWARTDMRSHMHTTVQTLDQLRESGVFNIQSPEECVELLRKDGPAARITFHPLCGGIPLDAAAECLRLFADRVLPALVATGGGADG
jgi:alkanesulfonate monooxygenase SsuD/methylene tetrahydromethanopterin reductase-like flavin-dependent oxidoreductase (luciferase family)